MNRDHQVTIDRTNGSEDVDDLIEREFIAVVRRHRDGKRVIRYAPRATEWFEAVALYNMAKNADMLTEAHRQRVRVAWRALDGRVRWNCYHAMLFAEAISVQ
jgi:hypothetical protein